MPQKVARYLGNIELTNKESVPEEHSCYSTSRVVSALSNNPQCRLVVVAGAMLRNWPLFCPY